MSEDFDKEAERKRLREKYEADREDREATERMSELLLQGATMTNQHCDTCGSPIFRYQGQAFCPTCQEERGQASGADGAGGGKQAAQAPSQTEEATQDSGPDQSTDAADMAGQTQPDPGQATQPTMQPGDASPEAAQPDNAGQTTGTGSLGQAAPAGSLDEARQSLVQTITSLTRRAAATEDPRQAKELLAAAREAAETLETLQGSR